MNEKKLSPQSFLLTLNQLAPNAKTTHFFTKKYISMQQLKDLENHNQFVKEKLACFIEIITGDRRFLGEQELTELAAGLADIESLENFSEITKAVYEKENFLIYDFGRINLVKSCQSLFKLVEEKLEKKFLESEFYSVLVVVKNCLLGNPEDAFNKVLQILSNRTEELLENFIDYALDSALLLVPDNLEYIKKIWIHVNGKPEAICCVIKDLRYSIPYLNFSLEVAPTFAWFLQEVSSEEERKDILVEGFKKALEIDYVDWYFDQLKQYGVDVLQVISSNFFEAIMCSIKVETTFKTDQQNLIDSAKKRKKIDFFWENLQMNKIELAKGERFAVSLLDIRSDHLSMNNLIAVFKLFTEKAKEVNKYDPGAVPILIKLMNLPVNIRITQNYYEGTEKFFRMEGGRGVLEALPEEILCKIQTLLKEPQNLGLTEEEAIDMNDEIASFNLSSMNII